MGERWVLVARRSLVFFAVWVVLSGKLDALHLSFGVLAALALALLQRSATGQKFPGARFAAYLPWLLVEIIKSNIHVARLVLFNPGGIAPRLIERQPLLDDDRARTLLAASITLTPGTLTLELDAEKVIVHALDPGSASSVEEAQAEQRIGRLFSKGAR